MKTKIILFLLFSFFSVNTAQVANHIVIAEIYGDGGNSGAVYKYDYVVLYNPTQNDIDLSTWSVQYSPATNYDYEVINLRDTILAFGYYLIRLKSSGENGSELPVNPNVIGNINISATSGKIALVNNNEAINNMFDENVVDFVGYGSQANEYEGTNYAIYPSYSTRSLCRKDNNGNNTYGNGNGWDTNDNRNDFFTNTQPSPLPVELIYFTGTANGNYVLLKWATATEVNNYGFEILRKNLSSTDNDWEKIGFVDGGGNSNSPKYYYFVDKPSGGDEFAYKLKQIDYDGTYTYSEEITIRIVLANIEYNLSNETILFHIFPNPFNPTTKIKYLIPDNDEYFNKKIIIKVFDISGNVVKVLKDDITSPGSYEINFSGSNLSSGIYIVALTIGNKTFIQKCILIK